MPETAAKKAVATLKKALPKPKKPPMAVAVQRSLPKNVKVDIGQAVMEPSVEIGPAVMEPDYQVAIGPAVREGPDVEVEVGPATMDYWHTPENAETYYAAGDPRARQGMHLPLDPNWTDNMANRALQHIPQERREQAAAAGAAMQNLKTRINKNKPLAQAAKGIEKGALGYYPPYILARVASAEAARRALAMAPKPEKTWQEIEEDAMRAQQIDPKDPSTYRDPRKK